MKMRLCGTTMGFTPEEQNQILQDNALKVYGFQPSVRR
jgi:predicted TIM-barrel fold metal-dependent hydrolase|tara:strand:- start:804 stop:917 length:114 start_codon:yes stop_codon:yes gene_type:complete